MCAHACINIYIYTYKYTGNNIIKLKKKQPGSPPPRPYTRRVRLPSGSPSGRSPWPGDRSSPQHSRCFNILDIDILDIDIDVLDIFAIVILDICRYFRFGYKNCRYFRYSYIYISYMQIFWTQIQLYQIQLYQIQLQLYQIYVKFEIQISIFLGIVIAILDICRYWRYRYSYIRYFRYSYSYIRYMQIFQIQTKIFQIQLWPMAILEICRYLRYSYRYMFQIQLQILVDI